VGAGRRPELMSVPTAGNGKCHGGPGGPGGSEVVMLLRLGGRAEDDDAGTVGGTWRTEGDWRGRGRRGAARTPDTDCGIKCRRTAASQRSHERTSRQHQWGD